MDFQAQLVENLRTQLLGINQAGAELVVALSGGADSVALLVALAQSDFSTRLRAIHVNHGLNESAADWQSFCEKLCASCGVPVACVNVQVSAAGTKQYGLEAAAREARYKALFERLSPSACLLTAHHADDLLETILFRLERGAGVRGLGGIKRTSIVSSNGEQNFLLRPLLDWQKSDLVAYLKSLKISWIEDESNSSLKFRRNYYRHLITPQLSPHLTSRLRELSCLAMETEERMYKLFVQWSAERQDGVEGLAVTKADIENLELTRYFVSTWLASQRFNLEGPALTEVLRQLQSGTGLGVNPTFTRGQRGLFINKRCVAVRRLKPK